MRNRGRAIGVADDVVHRPHADERQRRVELLRPPAGYCGASDSSGSVERTTKFICRGAKPSDAFGTCSVSMYSSVPAASATPPCLTSFSTPTIVNHGSVSPKPGLRRPPIGSRSAKNLRTSASLIEHHRRAADIRQLERRGP